MRSWHRQCDANETLLATALLLLVAATPSLSAAAASSSSCLLTDSLRYHFLIHGSGSLSSRRRHDLVAFPTALLLLGLEERVAHRRALPFRDPAVFGGRWWCSRGGEVATLGALGSCRGEPFAARTAARARRGSRAARRRSTLSSLPACDGGGRSGRSRRRRQYERERSRFEFVHGRDGARTRTRTRAGGGEVGERRGDGGEKVELGGARCEVRFEVG